MQWPIIDLIVPSAMRGRSPSRSTEDLAQRADFGTVAERNSGAVGLHESEAFGFDAGVFIRPAYGQNLAFEPRREHAHALAVARLANAIDHRIDAIADGRAHPPCVSGQ